MKTDKPMAKRVRDDLSLSDRSHALHLIQAGLACPAEYLAAPVITPMNAEQDGPDLYITEASYIGLAPGEWPGTLPTILGTGEPFLRSGGDCDHVVYYRQKKGTLELHILND